MFGGQSTSTYTAGTDGGETGSCRADRAIRYSNKLFTILDVGGQTQFTKTYWADDVKGAVRGLDGDAQFIAAGINANWRIMEFGFVYARQRNGDLVRITDPLRGEPISVAFDGEGQELFAKARLGKFAMFSRWAFAMTSA